MPLPLIARSCGTPPYFYRTVSVWRCAWLARSLISGGRYWDRTSGPCRVKQRVGADESRICERNTRLQQGFDVT